MLKKLLIALILFVGWVPALYAGEGKTFAVLPFSVHGPQEYQYLSQGIQSMLNSRLAAPGILTSRDMAAVKKSVSLLPTDSNAAEKIRQALGVDYLFWGSMTVMGQECSLDINTLDAQGTNQPHPVQTTLNQVIPSLETAAAAINRQVSGAGAQTSAPARIQQPMNTGLIVNESQSGVVYANPSLKYEEGDASMGRWRSQSYPFASRGMVVCDGDGDGSNEVFLLSESTLFAFRTVNRQLEKIAELKLPHQRNYVRLNSIDSNRDGRHELVISGVLDKDPRSLIVVFENAKLTIQTDNIPYHLGVISLPPAYIPTLVGQKVGRVKYLDSTIHQLTKSGDRYDLGPAINLPMGGTVYNVTFLPDGDSHQVLLVDDFDHIRIYSATGALLTTTEETYAGSNLGIDYHNTVLGMQAPESHVVPPDRVFIPLRGIATNLDKDSRYELLISRNISVSAQIFSNYRDYPQGEIHSMYWDGVGLSLQWKTARIKGTVTDYCLADIDNDGVLDLVVSMNSHTGMTGTAKKKTMLLVYPLDLSKSGPQIQKTVQ